jgi:hypothetical protein
VRRRTRGITRVQLAHQWPHHVALAAEKLHGLANAEIVRGFAATLSAAPITYHLRLEDRDFVVFCFSKPEDAKTFALRFGGTIVEPHRGEPP